MYLLDTNVLSELRKSRPHGGVVAWFAQVPDHALFVSAVTIGEIQAGIEITRRQDPTRADAFERWLDVVEQTRVVLPVDGPIWRRHARLMSRVADELYEDALIAATALAHGLTVATRNVRDFVRFEVPVVDPFKSLPKPRP